MSRDFASLWTWVLAAVLCTISTPVWAEDAEDRLEPDVEQTQDADLAEDANLAPVKREKLTAADYQEELQDDPFAQDVPRRGQTSAVVENEEEVALYEEGDFMDVSAGPWPYGEGLMGDVWDHFWFSATGADRGLGYEGSYITAGGILPFATDDHAGLWWTEARVHMSENAQFFSNVGVGRRQAISPETYFNVSFWYDFDDDQAAQFGHSFHQLGISGELRGPSWTARVNGYIPVGDTNYIQDPFVEHKILLQRGLDSALDGVDGEFGFVLPGLETLDARWFLGGYGYSSELVDSFVGFHSRIEIPLPRQWFSIQAQINHDNQFDTTGWFRLIFHPGRGARRADQQCAPCQVAVAPLLPTQRNDHIVRVHHNPIIALNPNNNDDPWCVIHVDNTADAEGNGTAERPFDTLAEAVEASDDCDIILVREGDGTTKNYNTEVALQPDQKLLGDGVEHFIDTQAGLFQLANDVDGNRPKITNTSGPAVVLATGVMVSGVDIEGAEVGIAGGDAVAAGGDEAMVDRVNINGGWTGIDIVDSDGNYLFTKVNITDTGGNAVNVIRGMPNVTFQGGVIENAGGVGFLVDATTDGTVFVDSTRIEDTGGQGIFVRNSTGEFIANDVIVDNPTGAGVDLFNNTDNTLTFTDIEITTDDAVGFRAENINTTGNSEIVVNGTSTVDARGGEALLVTASTDATPIDLTFASLSSINSPSSGILLDNVTGTLDVDSVNTTIDSSNASGIVIRNSMGLDVTFKNMTTVTTVGTGGTAVDLRDNPTSTFNLGNVSLATAVGAGLFATNSGTILSDGGRISVNGGAAMDISDTVVDLVFDSVFSTNSPGTGIHLHDNGGGGVSGTIRIAETLVTGAQGTGIRVVNAAAAGLDVDFGNTLVGQGALQGDGVELRDNNSTDLFTFNTLTVNTGDGAGFIADDGGTVNFVSSPTITATNGPAVDITGTTGQLDGVDGWVFADLTSNSSTTEGVRLEALLVDFDVTGTTTVANATNDGILVTNNTTDVTIASVNIDGATNGINLLSNTGDFTVGGGTIDSQVSNTLADGINIVDSNATIDTVTITNPGQHGIEVTNGADARSVTITDNTITGADQQGVELRSIGAGVLTATVTGNAIDADDTAFEATTAAASGTINLDLSGNTLESVNSGGANIDGTLGGTINITNFADNVVIGTANGNGGMRVNRAVFDADLVTVGIQQVAGGVTVIGEFNDRVQGNGLELRDVTGDLAYDRLDVFNNLGTGLLVQNPGGGFNLETGDGTISTTNGTAIDIDPTTVDLQLTSVASTSALGAGFDLDEVEGTIRIGFTTIIDAAGVGINVVNAGAGGLDVDFGNTTIATNGAQGMGINLANNNAADLFTFTTLDVTTSTDAGLVTRDGGIVNFVQPATIIATGGAAVDIDDLTTGQSNGVAGWTFRELGSSNSTAEGVRLDDLINDFTVTGRVTIEDATGDGILVTDNTTDISINRVSITGGTNGIHLIDSSGTFDLGGGTVGSTIDGTSADGIDITNSNASIDSVTITSAGQHGIEVNTAAAALAVSLTNNIVDGADEQGIELNVNGAGTLTATVSGNDVTSDGTAFEATTSAAGGDLNLVFTDNTLESTVGAGANIDGTLGGTLSITDFSDNMVTGTAAGSGGILVDTVVFDADLVTVGVQQVSGGNTIIGASGDRVQGDGLVLRDTTGDLAYDRLDIFNNAGTGLLVEKPGAGTFNLVTGDGQIDTTNGTAMDIDPATVNMTLASVTSTGASGAGLSLDQIAGTISIGRTTITDAGTGISVTDADAAGLDVNFGDTIVATTGSQGVGIRLDNNNATDVYTFNSVNVTTSNGAGFVANAAGIVNFTGKSAVIDATGGAAVDINGTGTTGQTNGVAGWTFDRLTSTASAAEGVRLIDVDDDFTVTGDTNIDGNSGIGVLINGGAGDVRFAAVDITNRNNVGVQVDSVTGRVQFTNVDIDNTQNAVGNAVNILNTGTDGTDGDVAILGGLIDDSAHDGIYIENSFATVQNVAITDAVHDGITIATTGTGSSTVLVTDSTINVDNTGVTGNDAITIRSEGTGTIDATITHNRLIATVTDDSLNATVIDGGTINLDARFNHGAGGGGPTNDFVLDAGAGTLNVKAVDAPDLSALNGGVTVSDTGSTFNAALVVPVPPAPAP